MTLYYQGYWGHIDGRVQRYKALVIKVETKIVLQKDHKFVCHNGLVKQLNKCVHHNDNILNVSLTMSTQNKKTIESICLTQGGTENGEITSVLGVFCKSNQKSASTLL